MITGKQYPSDEKLIFLACEDVRQEQNNKLSLMGLFVGGDVILTAPKPEEKILLPIAFIFLFTDGNGVFHCRAEIDAPSGKNLFKFDFETVERSQSNMILSFKIQNMPIQELGTYTIRLFLDDRAYTRRVPIIRRDSGT